MAKLYFYIILLQGKFHLTVWKKAPYSFRRTGFELKDHVLGGPEDLLTFYYDLLKEVFSWI